MLYNRLSYDFDSDEDPELAASTALRFAKALEERYRVTAVVFRTGFKGVHVVVPFSKPRTGRATS